MEKSIQYRLQIYEAFAHAAQDQELKWVVAHGSEGYPDNIGRDLDILCYDSHHTELAMRLFFEVSQKNPETRWSIVPHPIWGNRILAISKNYECAELHILYKLNSGLIDCPVDWNNVSTDLFPHSVKVSYFKSVLMPLIGGSAKVDRFSNEQIKKLPWSVNRLLEKNKNHYRINTLDKILVYIQLGKGNLLRMYNNYKYAKRIKSQIPFAATTPITLLPKDLITKIQTTLDEVFLDFVNGDNLSMSKIRYHQSRQRLVYLTVSRKDIKPDIIFESKQNAEEKIVDCFDSFNHCHKTGKFQHIK